MKQAHRYYRSSGAFSPLGIAITLGVGIVATAILSLIYGYALAWIPFIYINVFIILGYGFGVGMAVNFGGKMGKMRNRGVMLGLGLLVGLVAEYAGWVVWLYAMSSQTVLIFNPSELWDAITTLAEVGVWNLKGWTPTGVALYLMWGIEAVMVIGLATVMGASGADDPYCERCQAWVDKSEALGPFSPELSGDFLTDLESEKYEALSGLVTCPPADLFVQAELNHCPGCNQLHLLTLKTVALSLDKDGKTQRSEQPISEHLLVTSEVHKTIRDNASRPPVSDSVDESEEAPNDGSEGADAPQ